LEILPLEKAKFLWAKSDLVKSVGVVWLPSAKVNLVWFSLVTFCEGEVFLLWLPSEAAKFTLVRFGLVTFCENKVLQSLLSLCGGQVWFG
jgi:hypothetical protein